MPPPSSKPREPIVGPEDPEPPFPLKLKGKVIKGFGRGSKELGIPTANIPISGLSVGGNSSLDSGIYFGWAGLDFPSPPTPTPLPAHSAARRASSADLMASPPSDDPGPDPAQLDASAVFAALAREDEEQGWPGRGRVFPMVMSLGYNPFYKNTVRSVEVHILHDFARDFYGARLSLVILGFIRPEYDYVSKESLIEDIRTDIQVAARSLARPGYVRYRQDRALVEFDDVEDEEVGGDEKGEVVS